MKQVNITVNGRGFQLACPPEEEEYLLELAAEIDRRATEITQKNGEALGDNQTLLMIAISLLDELKDNAASRKIAAPLQKLTERAEKLAISENPNYKESA